VPGFPWLREDSRGFEPLVGSIVDTLTVSDHRNSEGLPTLKEAFANFLGIRRLFSFPVIIQPGTKILAN
jgi:hypothetical protein